MRQVGGRHYESTFQHWDLIASSRCGYFEGNATKYISRHQSKGGREDLLKARHYLVKLEELASKRAGTLLEWLLSKRPNVSPPSVDSDALTRFLDENRIRYDESVLITQILGWSTVDDIRRCISDLDRLSKTRYPRLDHPAPFGYEGEE